ncbi:dentin sialophosphoprotein [Anabrus simplex]|uniref:dentin sialophosphoprotein n=1 Tax=Anabrus simplex TaxID=316456 RepID=UPI0035A281DC
MEVPLMQFPPGDPRVVDKIASQLKSQGIFDQFRKECISDVDTKPAYQNLHQRVEGTVASFLASQEWRPDLNKNQLRDSLRKHIHESGFLDIGVERIVDQVVNPKIMTVFLPQIEDVVYKCLGLEKPKKGKEAQLGLAKQPSANVPQKIVTLKDLLPTDLDPISPESDGIKDKDELSEDEKEFESANNEEEEEEEEEEEVEEEEEEEEEEKAAEEEEVSPPFEPIEEINSQCDESSMDSRLSGISNLTSHDSQTSNASFSGNVQIANAKIPVIDLANHDSQLSKVSSGSRLSIVFSDDQEKLALKPPSSPPEIDIVNDESQLSKSSLQILSQESQASDNIEMSNQGSEESKATECIIVKDSSSDTSNVDTKSSSKSPNIILCENDQSKATCLDDAGDTNSSKTDSEEKSVENEKVEKKYIIEKESREKSLDPRDEKKRSRTGFESGDMKKNEHERKRSDKYRRDRGESKRSSRHDDKDRSDEKSKRDGGKGKESEKDIKKDRIRTDAKIEKEKMKLEERDEIRDKPKYAERFEIVVHKNKTKHNVDSEKDESADLGDKVSEDYPDDFERNGDKVKSDDLFGEDELKHDNLKIEGSRKADKSRHRSKYENKKERERNKERESGKSKGRHDDRLSKDASKEKSHNEDKFDRDSAKDREDKLKTDKDRNEKEGKERSRHESRSERDFNKEKSKHEEKIDKEGSKDKQKSEDKIDKSRQDRSKHSDKGEKDSNRDRTKHDAKQEKERRSDDKSKASFDKLSKEKKEDASKADEVDGDKREKSRTEVRKDKTGREKSKHEDRGRSKTDSKHKYSTKAEVKEDGSSRNEKSNHDRSGNRDSKTKSKSEGKENENRREEKAAKDRTKTDERNGRDKSSKSQSKGKENHEKKVDRKRDDSDSGKSSRSGDNKGKDPKKKDGKSKSIVDDHHIHRDKNTDDRRSTDRDSSGTQRSRTVSSRRSGSDTRSSHRHDKRDSNDSSGNNKSDGGGNSESAAELPEDSSDQASMEMPVSPPASLPFKKRPVQNQTADTNSREEYSCTMNAGKLILKSKKPKIAANIFEARKIMHLRKSMAKFERKKQKRWRKDQSGKRNAECRSDSDQENDIPPDSLSLDLTTKQEGSESDEEPLLFFSEEEARLDEDFIQFVKNLEESETLSQISWESSNESDNEIQPQLENNMAVNVVDSKEEGVQEDEIPNMNSCKFIESKDDLPSVKVIGNYAFDNGNEPLSETDEPFLKNTSIINNSEDTLPTTNESLFSNSSVDVKSTHNRRSRIKYEFSENSNRRVHSRRTSKAPESEGEINETALIVSNSKVVQDIGGIVQNASSRAVRTNSGNNESSISEGGPVCNQSLDKFDDNHSGYTVSNDYGHSVSNDVIEVPHETSPAPNLDYAISVDSTDDDDDDDDDDSDDEPIHKNTVHINDLDVDRNDYSYIGDNNNVDKSSSDDEKCGDGMSLSKELILPALRDLILESGFQLGDDLESTECLAAGSGMPTPDSQGEMSEKQSSAGSGSSASNASEKKRPKLGRSRRVGLGKPHPSKRLDVGKRVATPPAVAADFVMPLSPESDVSASSVEQIRKGSADVQADASSLSEIAETANFAHLDNDSEERRHLRSSAAGTPARHDQVNNNEDLFKPRPLFSQHKHGQFSSTQVEEPVVNCVGKRRRSTIESDGPQTSKRMRR